MVTTILPGADEVAGAHADGLDDSVGGGGELGFFQLHVELIDARLGLVHLCAAGVDVFFAIAALHEVGGGLRLSVSLLGGLEVFFARACLQKGEALVEGLGLLGGCVARCFCVVELLARDGVAANECLHALEVDLGVAASALAAA